MDDMDLRMKLPKSYRTAINAFNKAQMAGKGCDASDMIEAWGNVTVSEVVALYNNQNK